MSAPPIPSPPEDRGLPPRPSTNRDTLDQLAVKIYGTSFASLSHFAKEEIKRNFTQQYPTHMQEEIAGALDRATRNEIQELREKVASLITENDDLWRENEELKLHLYETTGEDW